MSLEDDIATLAQSPLIGLLDRDALRLLAFAAEKRRLRQGDVLFRKGDRADAGFVVAEGELGFDMEGGKPFAIARAGDLVGRTALFVRGERPATATAREPTTVMRISIDLMKRVLEEYPGVAAAMHAEIARDLDALAGELTRVGARLA